MKIDDAVDEPSGARSKIDRIVQRSDVFRA
jgi:hypothetical protein